MMTRTYTDGQKVPDDIEIEVVDTPKGEEFSHYCAEGPGHEWVWMDRYESWICQGCAAYGSEIEEDEPETAHLAALADPAAGDDSFPNDDVTVDDGDEELAF